MVYLKPTPIGIPVRSIISGIGSTAYKLSETITKMLTPLLGTISLSHVKGSGKLIKKTKRNKYIVVTHTDVKSFLYQNRAISR